MIDVGSTKCAIFQRNVPLFILLRDESSFVGIKNDKKKKKESNKNNNSVLYSCIMQWKESFA